MRPIAEESEPAVTVISFGDQYEQRVSSGLNNNMKSYSVALKVYHSEGQRVGKFLDDHAALTPFHWYCYPQLKTILVKCAKWTKNDYGNYSHFSMTFQQVIA